MERSVHPFRGKTAVFRYMAYIYFVEGFKKRYTDCVNMISCCRSAAVSRESSVDRQQHPLAATVGGRGCTGYEATGQTLQCKKQV